VHGSSSEVWLWRLLKWLGGAACTQPGTSDCIQYDIAIWSTTSSGLQFAPQCRMAVPLLCR